MIEHSNANPEVCVIGRCDFATSIGMITYAACEMLGRSVPVCLLPTEPALRNHVFVTLPNGREIPICRNPERMRATLFCDVLWNGTADHNWRLVPAQGLRLATLVWDSDELPAEWVTILNRDFDGVVCLSPHLEPLARDSGVEIPCATVPLALDLEPLLAEPFAARGPRLRIGSVSAFHPRKGTMALLRAFAARYAGRDDMELVLHSNLAFGDTAERVRQLGASLGLTNLTVSTDALSASAKNALIASFDVFANFSQGEGYSIGAREALALGKVLALSDVGGHQDLGAAPGVFLAPAMQRVPARFPEIDNRIFGTQRVVAPADAEQALVAAVAFADSEGAIRTRAARRDYAANFAFGRLAASYAALVAPDTRRFRRVPPPPQVHLPEDFLARSRFRIAGAGGLSHCRHIVVPAHDGGFFSVFNAFFSNLVWDLEDERCHRVLPDWDVDRMVERLGPDHRFTSFCYGRPGDGNVWLKLFQPLYGLDDAAMNDPVILYGHASMPVSLHNENREPLLTYVHAYRLYHRPWFADLRRQYNRAFREHIRLRPELAAEIEAFAADRFGSRFMIAAHVRHPSHTVEQPNAVIAQADTYIARIRQEVAQRGLAEAGRDWGVFLATDQERVVTRFASEFGERVAYFGDVRRTRAVEDAAFDALSPEERNRDGHQLQHLVASQRDAWSARMAWEVVRDAYAMARCHVLLHVVSNVSTAVAYMNPETELLFVTEG